MSSVALVFEEKSGSVVRRSFKRCHAEIGSWSTFKSCANFPASRSLLSSPATYTHMTSKKGLGIGKLADLRG